MRPGGGGAPGFSVWCWGVLCALSEWPPWQKNDVKGARPRGAGPVSNPVTDPVTPQVTPQVVRLLRAGTGGHPRRKLQALEHAALDMVRRRARLVLRLE